MFFAAVAVVLLMVAVALDHPFLDTDVEVLGRVIGRRAPSSLPWRSRRGGHGPMDDVELAMASASEQAELLQRREVSSRELVELYLERIGRLDGPLNSYVTVLDERARSEAAATDERLAVEDDVGALHGVPVSIKDLHFLAGARVTMGTASWADVVRPWDEAGLLRLAAQVERAVPWRDRAPPGVG